MKRTARTFWIILAALAVGIALLILFCYRNARADPVVRRATIALADWPAGAAPVTVVLLSDIHIGSPATDGGRLARVVAEIDALAPDLILIAGDFVAGHDPALAAEYAESLTAPLSRLRARLGVVAVLGNHDHWTKAATIRQALMRADVTVLDNDAVARPPLTLIGIDDAFSGHADPRKALAAAARIPGAPVVLSHTPDIVASLPASTAPLVLAGHTHCGQVMLPLIGAVVINIPRLGRPLYDPRYRCGIVRDPGRTIVVTGGIGATLPLRFRAPPDLWLLTLGPQQSVRR